MRGKAWMLTAVALTGLGLAQGTITLVGAGATFPYPLMAKYADEYTRLTGGKVRINYQSIGSGGGIRQFLEQTVHFGASDAPLDDLRLKEVRDRFKTNALNIGYALGAVVPTYNLPGVKEPLRFTGPVLADIYLGKIKTWNDPALQGLNPGVKLPPLPITVVHRSDGSGTTYVWTDYLSKVSPEWAQKVGRGTSVQWPVGVGGKGNEGVAGVVKQTPGAIGYVEVTYAKQNNLAYGAVRNKAGRFILADLASIRAAANVPLPGDMRVSLTDTAAPDGYPIASFTYLLLYENLSVNKAVKSEEEARALVEFVKWILTDGQKYNEPLTYGALSPVAQQRALALLSRVTYEGKPIGKEIVGR
ncbi:phosphate ABC transporter substrate-binding protein PstS [Thermus thermophilus]|uniref:phosphate ABC transporter substrate-binding protein PstS n=1 Tax=Thermus thermophilus TaxID=274 RepID=UPI001165C753|nr:phosphate ABC transporter substrate-binding protein PstS [Thermus thermophilus]BBL81346.1 phosphate-binding protein [Thermus thermophilus]BBL83649.1 phosphate-binding protein [Thermus thermophilus]BCZ93519.1 phosphate-binding protein [Thermus thermophilus]